MKSITINLCGPMQSYGYKNYFEQRKTKQKPTKSAIAGLLACCGGIHRDDKIIKEIEKSIEIEVEIFETPTSVGELNEKKDYSKILSDYQIARGTKENPIWNAMGKQKKTNLVIIKEYLMDTYFKVRITDTDENIDKYTKWLEDPVWVPYLGRKCCVPSIPIFYKEN